MFDISKSPYLVHFHSLLFIRLKHVLEHQAYFDMNKFFLRFGLSHSSDNSFCISSNYSLYIGKYLGQSFCRIGTLLLCQMDLFQPRRIQYRLVAWGLQAATK
jgi:hypothetical protein